ncbi:hypothetical protein [Kineococcus sp. SYSU DK006]|uniref:hypothetical protein n=1 Tax=Kineococcus sp. SYSU DK006 TaxID=3383127 RepID=UPI003D7D1D9A
MGHPLGLPSFAYAGEAALALVLADPGGELTRLQQQARNCPPALREAVVASLEEARSLLGGARKAVPRDDGAHVAGCLFRRPAVRARRARPHGELGRQREGRGRGGPDALGAALDAARALADDTAAACS